MSISPSDPTYRDFRRVLFCGKNPQALIRLYFDLLPLLERDPRLRFDFAVVPGSDPKHEIAAHRFLRKLELGGRATVVQWTEVGKSYHPELVVSASPTPEVIKLGVPAMFITHGAGNNRLRTDLTGPYGLAREQLVWNGNVVRWLPLAGRAAWRDLRRWCPEAVPNAEVVGDLRYERICESRALRREYRRKLGVKTDERLVVVSSTWGDLSLAGEGRMNLATMFLNALPMDEFKVAVIPHPNIEHGAGPSVAAELGRWLGNGLLMPPIEEGWAATIIAADLVVGDSGSVTQYAAAIRRAVLLSAFGYDQMPPDGALAGFGRATSWLNLDKPFAPQFHEAIARGQGFDFGDILANDRSPSGIIHAKVYELLGIQPPEFPGPTTLPVPELHYRCAPTWAWDVKVEFGRGFAQVTRRPVQSHKDVEGLLVVRHEDCDDNRIRTRANVLLHHSDPLPRDEAIEELVGLHEDWPHWDLASARTCEGELLMLTRQRLLIRVQPGGNADIIASALASWLAEQPANAARLCRADAFVDFERGFEPAPTILSVETLG
ncbi:hypothetical protein [Glycomyces artemisiae]|uniref:CDP-glycerol:poly(Glycerophosphate) glycerophosphotransferase n=1 Tax=Glycomyces artemisiae TaxID=1076443 RepID=A0A2T0USS7_9ACTN|nr:hypothetical protein [Glycomyces artemisiae]PRY60982.1 hypothetical protein B0I28_102597 [Glycomyces artemisiae]